VREDTLNRERALDIKEGKGSVLEGEALGRRELVSLKRSDSS